MDAFEPGHLVSNCVTKLLQSLNTQLIHTPTLQVVVDAFEPGHLVSNCVTKPLDFGTISEAALLDIDMPLQVVPGGCVLAVCCSGAGGMGAGAGLQDQQTGGAAGHRHAATGGCVLAVC